MRLTLAFDQALHCRGTHLLNPGGRLRRPDEALGQCSAYTASLKVYVKVLDFAELGGPRLAVGRTAFEVWVGL